MLTILKLRREITDLEFKINSNRFLLVCYNKELKKKLLKPSIITLVLSLCFFAGFYFEYNVKKNKNRFFFELKNVVWVLFSYFIKSPFYGYYLTYRYLINKK